MRQSILRIVSSSSPTPDRNAHDWADIALDGVLAHKDTKTRLIEATFRGCHAARNHFLEGYPTQRELGIQSWLDVGQEVYLAMKPMGWASFTPAGQRVFIPSSDMVQWCTELLYFRASHIQPHSARRYGMNPNEGDSYFRLYPNRRVNTKTRLKLQGRLLHGGQRRWDVDDVHQPLKHKTLCLLYDVREVYDSQRNMKDLDVFAYLAVPKLLSDRGNILECSRFRALDHMMIGQMQYGPSVSAQSQPVTVTPIITPARETGS